ncbi:hypothetical protein N9V97_01145 [Luminiphilus sp.]|nr:hypothetical protein [Luminiphilus sp.]
MRWIVIAILVGLAGCGMSAEEKKNIAAATCSLLSEYSDSDGVARIKEINSAREKLHQPLFLGSSEDIQDALEYGVCSDLVLNDLDYNIRLAEAKQSRVEKLQQFLDGAWFFEPDKRERSFVVAEFLEANLVLSHYSFGYAGAFQKTRELNFRTEVFSDGQVIASGSGEEEFRIHIDWEGNTIRLDVFFCTIVDTCIYKKAPQISLTDITGIWLEIDPDNQRFQRWYEYLEGSHRMYAREYIHEDKTFSDSFTGSCEFKLESGFTMLEVCEGLQAPLVSFITKYSNGQMQMNIGEFVIEYERLDEFPPPPAGYRDITKK